MEFKNLMFLTLCLIISNFCFTFSSAQCPADKDKDWSYDRDLPNGPMHWGDKYPNCNDKNQSPINIITSETTNSGKRQALQVEGYNKPVGKVKIVNNGHYIDIEIQDGVERSVTVDDKKYKLTNIHFHWGNKTTKGSENEINGNRYEMEINLVHRVSGDEKPIVVSGFFSENNDINSAIDNILFVKDYYDYKGESFEGEIQRQNSDPTRQGKIYLDELINTRCRYFRYFGSRTFPPCTEDVTWLVCRNDMNIKTSQMNELFSLHSVERDSPDADKCHIVNCFRPVQPLNGRKVYA